MSEKKEMISRLKAKNLQLRADLAALKIDASEAVKNKKAELEKKLTEISDMLSKVNEDFSEGVAKKINSWLK